jgi:hypothetical protein
MNVLTGNYKGFTVGSTVNACTKGWKYQIIFSRIYCK